MMCRMFRSLLKAAFIELWSGEQDDVRFLLMCVFHRTSRSFYIFFIWFWKCAAIEIVCGSGVHTQTDHRCPARSLYSLECYRFKQMSLLKQLHHPGNCLALKYSELSCQPVSFLTDLVLPPVQLVSCSWSNLPAGLSTLTGCRTYLDT